MAIIQLGNNDMVVGTLPVTFNSFNYNQSRAYGIYAETLSPNYNNVFSYINIYPRIEPNNGTPFLLNPPIRLDIVAERQLFYIPMSRIFGSNGTCVITAERIPYIRQSGERVDANLVLSYDDQQDTPSWRA